MRTDLTMDGVNNLLIYQQLTKLIDEKGNHHVYENKPADVPARSSELNKSGPLIAYVMNQQLKVNPHVVTGFNTTITNLVCLYLMKREDPERFRKFERHLPESIVFVTTIPVRDLLPKLSSVIIIYKPICESMGDTTYSTGVKFKIIGSYRQTGSKVCLFNETNFCSNIIDQNAYTLLSEYHRKGRSMSNAYLETLYFRENGDISTLFFHKTVEQCCLATAFRYPEFRQKLISYM